jgi:hypothetical protein
MNKSIQQILEEEREKSRLGEVSEATINRTLANEWKREDLEFSKTMSKVATERNQDPEYLQSLRVGIANRDNTYQAEVNRRPEKRALQSERQTGRVVSQETRKKLKSIKTNKYGDANYEAAHKAGLAKRDKPFHAGEYGIFQSRLEAARYATEQGLKNAVKKFEVWTKTNPTEYYFVTN